jgi:hypothetical protein
MFRRVAALQRKNNISINITLEHMLIFLDGSFSMLSKRSWLLRTRMGL